MAHITKTMPFLQDPDWGECCEKILLPPTDPNAEVIDIPGYTLVYCNGACPKNYRVYKADSMIGLVFQHLTHWSNEVDEIRYAQPLSAAMALDDFCKAASMTKAADKSIAA
ncbi:hypothetical protein I8752_08465 [Nostocaceae cyanobacterium CENA369]|uniref:Uncharacterized protein n=1 Tax=Dendronalium phyllosphericum CENA369 TaxID=1725256 RepID=A0A8J7HZD1_9NOST|nr:hypothetical protein [Dendronalium phyllosphericum]MBH8573046.1 hypothetical protein [Dendronalium phyllosphericum CENA369]